MRSIFFMTIHNFVQVDELASSLKIDLQPHYEIIVELLSKKMSKAALRCLT